jgi:long-chain acyl-CoA synthetase
VFRGYWRQPRESHTMLHDGWLYTADIAAMDRDGFVTLIDRKRDVILASGFSIFPSEIEDVLGEHPAIESCAVVGVSHYYRGETAKAYVVLHEGSFADEQELQKFCARRLAAYKVPSSFEFRTDLPRNMLGKVLRRVLRDEYEALRARTHYDDPMPDDAFDLSTDHLSTDQLSDALTEQLPGELPDFLPDLLPNGLSDQLRPVDRPRPEGRGVVDEIERLVRLRDTGALNDDEFTAAKTRLLS